MRKTLEFLRGFKDGFKKFGAGIVNVSNFILLTPAYFLGVGFTSIFAKLFGKRFLDLKLSKKANTYWSDLNLKKKSIENYYKQF